jgi:subtilisin family serine protease
VSLLIARVLDVKGSGNTDDVIAAVDWCVSQGANIASLSLGSSTRDDDEELAFIKALGSGMLSFAATGNSGASKVAFPAGYSAVVAVGAVNFAGEWASFSQYGPEVSLVGPGVDVLSSTIVGASPFSNVTAGATEFTSSPLEYSAINTYTGRLVNCGLGESISSCGDGATCEGFVAYVDRGGDIHFDEKARNAIQAGAKAVIIGNNVAEDAEGNFTLTAPSSIWVPTTSVSLDNGAALKKLVGQQVTVDVSGTDYLVQSGTSMATPHVSGVAALLWSARRDLTAAQVREALEGSAKDLGPAGRDSQYGYGLVQAQKAIQYANTKWPRQVP